MIFELRESALLRLALGPVRFDPWEFFDEAAYPAHRAEKDEVEAFVREYVVGLDRPGLEAAVRRHRSAALRRWTLRRNNRSTTWTTEPLHGRTRKARSPMPTSRALPAYTARGDLVFREHPALYDTLTDGLMRLTPAHIEEPWLAENATFFVGESALFAHPFLAEYRELLGVLAELSEDPSAGRVCRHRPLPRGPARPAATVLACGLLGRA